MINLLPVLSNSMRAICAIAIACVTLSAHASGPQLILEVPRLVMLDDDTVAVTLLLVDKDTRKPFDRSRMAVKLGEPIVFTTTISGPGDTAEYQMRIEGKLSKQLDKNARGLLVYDFKGIDTNNQATYRSGSWPIQHLNEFNRE
jgi:hypothetical protein